MKKILTLLFFVLLCSHSFAATYYVKTGGNDSNTGLSEGQAWLTLGKLNTVDFADGDIIQLNGGDTFDDAEITFASVTGSNKALTIQNYGTGNAIIDTNSIQFIDCNNTSVIGLTIKNIQMNGMDASISTYPDDYAFIYIEEITDLTLDNVNFDGHAGSPSSYTQHNGTVWVDKFNAGGSFEAKNCTMTNGRPGPASDPTQWDHTGGYNEIWNNTEDYQHFNLHVADGIAGNPWTSGTATIYDNTLTKVYADIIQCHEINLGAGNFTIYNNTMTGYGENAFDSKSCRNIDFYNNQVSRDGYGLGGSGVGYSDIVLSKEGGTANVSTDWDIYENRFYDSGAYVAIRIISGSNTVTIRENHFDNVGTALHLDDTDASDITFENNWGTLHANNYGTLAMIDVYAHSGHDNIIIRNNSFRGDTTDHDELLYWLNLDSMTGNKIVSNLFILDGTNVYPANILRSSGSTMPEFQYNGCYNNDDTERVYWHWVKYEDDEQAAFITAASATGTDFFYNETPDVYNIESNQLWPTDGGDLDNAGDPTDSSSTGLHSTSTWNPFNVLTGVESARDIGAYENYEIASEIGDITSGGNGTVSAGGTGTITAQ